MQKTKFRNRIHLYSRKIAVSVLFFLFAFTSNSTFAQQNYLDFANKSLYFGISLGYNTSDFKIIHSNDFIQGDSILTVHTDRGPGFQLGIISNLEFSNYFDVRFVPTLSFAEKSLDYKLSNNETVRKNIESINLEFPVSIRFKSQPVNDVRFYVMAGLKYNLDLASNAEARQAEDMVRVTRHDYSVEYGLGIQIYFPLFVFSPEIKISHGLVNIHAPNEDLIFSNVIDQLFSRTIMISFNFEG
ncbi:MAG: PorT family protein [Chitinophagaceae bacterium]|nr:MAG: PorT family protein [Chitinophagaceae bacterium]